MTCLESIRTRLQALATDYNFLKVKSLAEVFLKMKLDVRKYASEGIQFGLEIALRCDEWICFIVAFGVYYFFLSRLIAGAMPI